MRRTSRPWKTAMAASAGLAFALLAALPGSAGATTPNSALVLNSSTAKALGFTHVLQAAKASKVTSQKGCTKAVESVFEDAAGKTGLISETLQCSSPSAATKALATVRKKATVDTTRQPPKQLGRSAFITASNAPEYFMVWQSGTRLGVTVFDVDVSATSESVVPALSAAQLQTLSAAALRQNSLY